MGCCSSGGLVFRMIFIQRILNLTRAQTQHALWELATAGLAAADGFDQLRAMMDPRRKSVCCGDAGEAEWRGVRRGGGRSLSEEMHASSGSPSEGDR